MDTLLPPRTLGKAGLPTSSIGIGTWAIGGGWGPQPEEQSLAALRTALEQGCRFIDTAALYGAGRAERLVGQILVSAFRPVTVATKIVPTAYQWAPPSGTPIEHIYSPTHILAQVDESLRRLQLDCIDCVLFQTWCPTWTEPGAWYDTMLHLQQQGKIRTFGISVSDHRADEANVLIADGFIDLVEVPYSVLDQRAATTLFPQAVHSHASILVRSPLASGALAEDWRSLRFHRRDWRRRVFRGNQLDRTLRRVQEVRSVFGPDLPLAQGALRFCLSHPAVSTVIVGVREASHVLEACAAARCGPLPDDVLGQCSAHWQNEWCHEVRTSIGGAVERAGVVDDEKDWWPR